MTSAVLLTKTVLPFIRLLKPEGTLFEKKKKDTKLKFMFSF